MAVEDRVIAALRLHMAAVFESFEVPAEEQVAYLSALIDERAPPRMHEPSQPPVIVSSSDASQSFPIANIFDEPSNRAMPVTPNEIADDGEFFSTADLEAALSEEFEELPAEVPEPEPAIRRAPRFDVSEKVEIALGDRAELKELWMRDISKGGLFVQTEEELPLETQIVVGLTTPDGRIELKGVVVHVAPNGVGLEFSDLDDETREALENYVDGVAGSLEQVEKASAADEVGDAKTFLALLQERDIYAALDISSDASLAELKARLSELEFRFSADTENAAEQTRLETALRALARFRTEVFSNPARWMAYDFMHGHVRAEARLASSDANALRGVWARIFPERVKAAAEHWARAKQAATNGRHGDAVASADEALELDPFQVRLRAARSSWVHRAELEQLVRKGESPERIAGWAASIGVERDDLRSLWHAIHPDKVLEAKAHAQKALQAIELKMGVAALDAGELALALDPFNDELEQAVMEWRTAVGA